MRAGFLPQRRNVLRVVQARTADVFGDDFTVYWHAGRAVLGPQQDWQSIKRISVQSGEDILVLDPALGTKNLKKVIRNEKGQPMAAMTSTSTGAAPAVMLPDGMPVILTEIRPTSGTMP